MSRTPKQHHLAGTIQKYLARAGDSAARIQQLFIPAPDVRLSGYMFPVSTGFTLGDVLLLTDVACDASLDRDDAAPVQAAPLHALHALMRLGTPALELAAPRLIQRALLVSCGDDSDYTTELLCKSLEAALVGCGLCALPHIAGGLLAASRSSAHWRGKDAWLGIGVLASALTALPFSLGDLSAGDAAAAALLDSIDAVYQQWRSDATPPREAARGLTIGLSSLVECAAHLGPFLRANHAARALPLLRAIKLDRGVRNQGDHCPGSVNFARLLGCMGIEAMPGDPALAGVSVPTSEDVRKMWVARHGPSTRPPGPPYPGADGYMPPPIWSPPAADSAAATGVVGEEQQLQWVAPMRCAYALCGVDIDAMSRAMGGIGGGEGPVDEAAFMASLLKGLSGASEPANIEKLQACAGCRTVVYCSPACQRSHWVTSSAVRKSKLARLGGGATTSGAEYIPCSMDSSLVESHKAPCKLMVQFLQRAQQTSSACLPVACS
jgi:hypothetical protein